MLASLRRLFNKRSTPTASGTDVDLVEDPHLDATLDYSNDSIFSTSASRQPEENDGLGNVWPLATGPNVPEGLYAMGNVELVELILAMDSTATNPSHPTTQFAQDALRLARDILQERGYFFTSVERDQWSFLDWGTSPRDITAPWNSAGVVCPDGDSAANVYHAMHVELQNVAIRWLAGAQIPGADITDYDFTFWDSRVGAEDGLAGASVLEMAAQIRTLTGCEPRLVYCCSRPGTFETDPHPGWSFTFPLTEQRELVALLKDWMTGQYRAHATLAKAERDPEHGRCRGTVEQCISLLFPRERVTFFSDEHWANNHRIAVKIATPERRMTCVPLVESMTAVAVPGSDESVPESHNAYLFTDPEIDKMTAAALAALMDGLEPDAMDQTDGSDFDSDVRIDHAQDLIEQARDALLKRGYVFSEAERLKFSFLTWPASPDEAAAAIAEREARRTTQAEMTNIVATWLADGDLLEVDIGDYDLEIGVSSIAGFFGLPGATVLMMVAQVRALSGDEPTLTFTCSGAGIEFVNDPHPGWTIGFRMNARRELVALIKGWMALPCRPHAVITRCQSHPDIGRYRAPTWCSVTELFPRPDYSAGEPRRWVLNFNKWEFDVSGGGDDFLIWQITSHQANATLANGYSGGSAEVAMDVAQDIVAQAIDVLMSRQYVFSGGDCERIPFLQLPGNLELHIPAEQFAREAYFRAAREAKQEKVWHSMTADKAALRGIAQAWLSGTDLCDAIVGIDIRDFNLDIGYDKPNSEGGLSGAAVLRMAGQVRAITGHEPVLASVGSRRDIEFACDGRPGWTFSFSLTTQAELLSLVKTWMRWPAGLDALITRCKTDPVYGRGKTSSYAGITHLFERDPRSRTLAACTPDSPQDESRYGVQLLHVSVYGRETLPQNG